MSEKQQKYYIGLDCGTNSVGWAVTDEKYNILQANAKTKKDGKVKTRKRRLEGVRLFDSADTAADRRVARSNRRRNSRAKQRLKLLQMLFEDEMVKVDPEFYQRLRESFYWEEDKSLANKSKNTLFNDSNFTDKDFHKLYPTIWHLRKNIIKADDDQHFDLRLYFLAIQHILKHRGHFLLSGRLEGSNANFQELFDTFYEACDRVSYRIDDTCADFVKQIVKDKNKSKVDKKKELKERIFNEGDEKEEDMPKGQAELAGLLVGSKVSLTKIFGIEGEDYKFSFAESDLDEKLPEIESAIGSDNLDLILAAKRIYDYGVLSNLLGNNDTISDAMVAHYDQHKKDLKELKRVFKPHKEQYDKLFKTKVDDDKKPISYNAYIGKARSVKDKPIQFSQEDFNKQIKVLLEEISYTGELLERAERGELLPKQRGQAKGTIPQQLHHNELKIILERLAKDYPSFAEEDASEDEKYNTKCKKILQIHYFRIPYYCGPIVKRKYDDEGKLVSDGKSQFSWANEEINEIVYPWNFDKLVNKEMRADNFIRRMTNKCTYLFDKDVLPKSSLLYQKYMVLNELNNLRINGRPLDVDLKQEVYERVFLNGELSGNITSKRLEKWLKQSQLISSIDILSGTNKVKFLPKLQTYQDLRKWLGSDFTKRYSQERLEKMVEAITILGDEKTMLKKKVANILGLDEKDSRVQHLAKLSYKDWGKFSAEFLDGIRVDDRTILDWLWESQYNLQQLLGQEVGFGRKVEEYNAGFNVKFKPGTKISYNDVQSLYCSPAVKRSIWQTVKIINEIVKTQKNAPTKIFIEVTRGEDEKSKGQLTTARKKDLETKLKAVKTEDAKKILAELGGKIDADLRQKKLFLYFSQMGRCAYSGESINLEDLNNTQICDIDHIYPRSKTKDDSITRNLVLVKAEYNRRKTDRNLCEFPEWQHKMMLMWQLWRGKGLITEEKYNRLTRTTPLSNDELGGFIARQIVETSQTVKAIRDLLARAYPNTKVVMVKAGQVSDFRHLFANGIKYRDSDEYKVAPRPEFIKIRELNDFHHAKDAYLNIVVGNVMNSTFTDDPYEWIKRREGKNYTITPERIFRDSYVYQKSNGEESHYPETQGWDFAESIRIISDTMKQNDILWTRMSYVESSEMSDLQLVHKTKKADGMLSIKQDERLRKIDRYGGYNSIKGAHFALIECPDKKGNLQRRIISIPQIYKTNIKKYVVDKYPGAEVVIPVIRYKVKMQFNDFPLHIAGKSGGGLVFYNARQLVLCDEMIEYLKDIMRVNKRDQELRGKYEIDHDRDGIDCDKNIQLFDALCLKMALFETMPSFGAKVSEIRSHRNDFVALDLKAQVVALINFVKILKCNAETGDISSFVPKSSFLGKPTASEDIVSRSEKAELINQSPTGLYQENINLKIVQPKSRRVKVVKTNREL